MLAPTDVAIAVHQVIKVEKMRGYVASTPLSVSSSAAFSVAPEKVPLVLTAGVFDLTTLQTAIAWEFSPDICYAISMDGRMHVDSSMSRLLQQLVATPGGLQLDRSSLAEHQDQLALLKERNFAESSSNTVGKDVWKLTESGRKAIVTCYETAAKAVPVLQLRDVPVTDMNKYELMMALSNAGWTMRVVSKKESRALREEEAGYMEGPDSKKEWYVLTGATLASVKPLYLKLLLQAGEHKKRVPHLAAVSVYQQLLNPGFVPRARKRQAILAGDPDDW
ncbi:hypothetical protein AK812_SmicGene48798, partial [Symbiodinium microadriaticum]